LYKAQDLHAERGGGRLQLHDQPGVQLDALSDADEAMLFRVGGVVCIRAGTEYSILQLNEGGCLERFEDKHDAEGCGVE